MAKAKRVQSWGDIDPKVFEQFYAAVEKLRDEMIPRDCDNDSPIEVLIINRMTHLPITEWAVPRAEIYSYKTHGYLDIHPDKLADMQIETERVLSFNMKHAAEAFNHHVDMKYFHHQRDREHARPVDERIVEKCQLCAQKVEFDPTNDKDFASERLTKKYPDYPARYHVKDQECKAYELRRFKFNKAHPEYAGVAPEPRWCMNPDCRCKLSDYNSKKGVKDKNICLNPRCGMDNSKYYPEATDATS